METDDYINKRAQQLREERQAAAATTLAQQALAADQPSRPRDTQSQEEVARQAERSRIDKKEANLLTLCNQFRVWATLNQVPLTDSGGWWLTSDQGQNVPVYTWKGKPGTTRPLIHTNESYETAGSGRYVRVRGKQQWKPTTYYVSRRMPSTNTDPRERSESPQWQGILNTASKQLWPSKNITASSLRWNQQFREQAVDTARSGVSQGIARYVADNPGAHWPPIADEAAIKEALSDLTDRGANYVRKLHHFTRAAGLEAPIVPSGGSARVAITFPNGSIIEEVAIHHQVGFMSSSSITEIGMGIPVRSSSYSEIQQVAARNLLSCLHEQFYGEPGVEPGY